MIVLFQWTDSSECSLVIVGIPAVTPMGVFSTLCLDVTMNEWLTGIEEEANVPHAWADDGWSGMSPDELVCVFTYLTIRLALGDLAVESGILLAAGQIVDSWSKRDVLVLSPNPGYYAAGSLVHNIIVDLSQMVRVCLTELTPKK